MARQSPGEEAKMGKTHFLFGNLLCICVIFFSGVATLPGAEEKASPGSRAYRGLTPASLDYPDHAALKHSGIIPLSGYSTEKGKALARRYQSQLVQIVAALEKDFPPSQMEVRAAGFLKSPQCGQKDDRYLSVIVEVSEEYESMILSIDRRAGAVFKKYIESIAKILLKQESILEDKDVEGIAICPNWMLKRTKEASRGAAMSEGIFVCIGHKIAKDFLHGTINLDRLATKAKIYARQGDNIFALTNIQLEEAR